jgi:hypothetical protein
MSSTPDNLRARNLRMLAVMAGLFLLPLILAFYMYYATDWRPVRRVNHGTLISPARPLPNAPSELRRKWTMVYVGEGNCDERCRQALYVMRQTRLSLNNEMDRVGRVFLSTGNCCAREFLEHEHPGLVVMDASGANSASLLHEFPADGRPYSLFVVDPLGNLMMSYDARQNPKGLLEDLKKLLRLSHIG